MATKAAPSRKRDAKETGVADRETKDQARSARLQTYGLFRLAIGVSRKLIALNSLI